MYNTPLNNSGKRNKERRNPQTFKYLLVWNTNQARDFCATMVWSPRLCCCYKFAVTLSE